MNNFDRLAKDSNEKGLKYLNKIFENKQETIIKEEFDNYSTNDFIIYNNDESILVEIKVRKRFYENLVFEYDKMQRLLDKSRNIGVDKVWYLNVIEDDTTDYKCIIFNAKKIFNSDIIDRRNEVLFPGQVDELIRPTNPLLCKYMMPKYTAKYSEKIPKLSYIIPINMGFGFKKLLF